MTWPPDTCEWCADGEVWEAVAELGAEGPYLRVGYECPAGHRWFTRFPKHHAPEEVSEVRCGECEHVVHSRLREATGHIPSCSHFRRHA